MLDKPYNINRVITTLAISIVVYMLYIWILYEYMSRVLSSTSASNIAFNKWVFLFPALVLVDICIYIWLRNQYIVRRYANIHTWSVIIQLMVLPVLSLLAVILVSHYYGLEELATVSWLSGLVGLVGLFFFIVGHVFLLMLISKRNDHKVQAQNPDDYLHEFERP